MENSKEGTPKNSRIPVLKNSRSSSDSWKSSNSSSPKSNKTDLKRVSPNKFLTNKESSLEERMKNETNIDNKTTKIHFSNLVAEGKNEKESDTHSNPMQIDTSKPQENSSSKKTEENKAQEKILPHQNDDINFNKLEIENFNDNFKIVADQIKDALVNVTYEDIDDFSPENLHEGNEEEEWYTLGNETVNNDKNKLDFPKQLTSSKRNSNENEQYGKRSHNESLTNVFPKNNLFTLSETLDEQWKELRKTFPGEIVEKFKELLAKEQLKICLDCKSRCLDGEIDVDEETEEEIKTVENLKIELEKLEKTFNSLKSNTVEQLNYDDIVPEFTVEFIFPTM